MALHEVRRVHDALFLLLDRLSKGLAEPIVEWRKHCDKLKYSIRTLLAA
jgi:hypothetical protein